MVSVIGQSVGSMFQEDGSAVHPHQGDGQVQGGAASRIKQLNITLKQ